MFVLISGTCVTESVKDFTDEVTSLFPTLYVDDLGALQQAADVEHEVLIASSTGHVIRKKTILDVLPIPSLCSNVMRYGFVYVLIYILFFVGMFFSHDYGVMSSGLESLSIGIACLFVCTTLHICTLSIGRLRLLIRCYEPWYVLGHTSLYVTTLMVEWMEHGAVIEMVVCVGVLLSVTFTLFLLMDAASMQSQAFRVGIRVVQFLWFFVSWVYCEAISRDTLRPATRKAFELEYDILVDSIDIATIKGIACINLLAVIGKGILLSAFRGRMFDMLKLGYRVHSIIREDTIMQEPTMSPRIRVLAPRTQNPLVEPKSEMHVTSSSNADGLSVIDLVDEGDASSQARSQSETDGLAISISAFSSATSPRNKDNNTNASLVGLRGCFVCETEAQAEDIRREMTTRFPLVMIDVVPHPNVDEYEVLLPAWSGTVLPTKPIVPQASRIWEHTWIITTSALFLLVAYFVQVYWKVFDVSYGTRFTLKAVFRAVTLVSLTILVAGHSRGRLKTVLKSLDALLVIGNLILLEVWNVAGSVLRNEDPWIIFASVCTRMPFFFTIFGDPVRHGSFWLRGFVYLIYMETFVSLWCAHRFNFEDEFTTEISRRMIEIGVVRATLSTIRQTACFNIAVFCARYIYAVVVVRSEFLILKIPLLQAQR
eukprot:PhF_6_TR11531/c0_g1_i3/m.18484